MDERNDIEADTFFILRMKILVFDVFRFYIENGFYNNIHIYTDIRETFVHGIC